MCKYLQYTCILSVGARIKIKNKIRRRLSTIESGCLQSDGMKEIMSSRAVFECVHRSRSFRKIKENNNVP